MENNIEKIEEVIENIDTKTDWHYNTFTRFTLQQPNVT